MHRYDNIGVDESITVERWNRVLREVLAPAIRPVAERWNRTGTRLAAGAFDRNRYLFAVECRTRQGFLSGGTVFWKFRLPTAARLRRVFTLDGFGSSDEIIRLRTLDLSGGTPSTIYTHSSPPFDDPSIGTTLLDPLIPTTRIVEVSSVDAGGVDLGKTYVVTLQFAADLA